jgi:ABC-2 type transport system ATP-binding protein
VSAELIVFENVSKFYGDVLGVNKVDLKIPPGITSLVGPNGSGKTTLMNLMSGLVHPGSGKITVRGISPFAPDRLMRILGYATQYDAAPRGVTGYGFVLAGLLLYGYPRAEAERRATRAIEIVSLTHAAARKIAAYSKGMRQRIRLAQAIAHEPAVLVLDEPLNGLDPLVRAETIALFRDYAAQGRHVILSSHVLQEVDVFSDQVILIANGMIVAEGEIKNVRDEIHEHPSQFLLQCQNPTRVASLLFETGQVLAVKIDPEGRGVLVTTRHREAFATAVQQIALGGQSIEGLQSMDENVDALYEYLIGGGK